MVHAQDNPTGSWSAEQSGQNFYQGAAATDGTYLFLAGGFQFGVVSTFPQYYQQLRRYDPIINSFTTMAQMPFPKYLTSAAFYDGSLYVLGGYNLSAGPSNTIERYTVATNTWSVLSATLSSARYYLASATLGDRIYAMGGFGPVGPSPQNDEFNPLNNTVTARANMPQGMYLHTLSAVPSAGRLYAITGFTNAAQAFNFEYDPENDSWANRTSLQNGAGAAQPRYAATAFSLDDRVYVAGGIAGATPSSATWEYDPAGNSWARRANMGVARYLFGGAAISGKGYVYGGASSTTTGEEFTPPFFNQPPVADAGPDETVECMGHGATEVQLDGSGSFDPDGDDLTYFWEGPFGEAEGVDPVVELPLGENEITLTVMDPFGETSSDTVVITVEDTLPPDIAGVAASPESLWPPNHTMRDVTVTVDVSDLCDPAPLCEIILIESSQDQGNESDWEITGDLAARLRAERSDDQARTYTITVQCTDASGNSSTATVTVTVPLSQGQ